MQKRRELRADDNGKKMEGKKMAVRPATAGSSSFCASFFCRFIFEFVPLASTTVNRRRLKLELQQSVARPGWITVEFRIAITDEYFCDSLRFYGETNRKTQATKSRNTNETLIETN